MLVCFLLVFLLCSAARSSDTVAPQMEYVEYFDVENPRDHVAPCACEKRFGFFVDFHTKYCRYRPVLVMF